MITTSDSFAIDDSKTRFAGASCYCLPRYLADTEMTIVDVQVIDDSAVVDSGILATFTLEFDNAALTAFTPTGANAIEEYYNLVEQAVDDYLENLGANSGATFSIV